MHYIYKKNQGVILDKKNRNIPQIKNQGVILLKDK